MRDLVNELRECGLSVLKISNEVEIPASRIYKWFEGKGAPKFDDAAKLRSWLDKRKGNVEEVPTSPDTYREKYIALLEQQIGVLNQAIQANLTALSTGQEYLSAYVKAAVTRSAERHVKDDPEKRGKELDKIDKIYVQILEGKQTGTPVGIQGKGLKS